MIDVLTSLRFFAILLIYFHHLSYPGGLGPPAVTFFFVLSGFIIAYSSGGRFLSLDLNEFKGFYIKRLSKVYPLHILTFFISLPIVYVTKFETNFFSAFLNIFLLQSYFPIGIQVFSFNALAWFLSDIVFFYFLTPFLLSGLQKIQVRENRSLLLLLLLFVFACEAMFAYLVNSKMEAYSMSWWLFYISPWMRIFDYSAGLIAGLIFVFIKINSSKIDSQTAASKILFSLLEAMALAVFAGSIYYSRFITNGSFLMSAYYVPFSIILVFVFSFQKGALSWFLTRNSFIYLGSLSFTFFMLHQIVILYSRIFFLSPNLLFMPDLKNLTPQFLLLINIIFLSDVTFRYFEVPIGKIILTKFGLGSKNNERSLG